MGVKITRFADIPKFTRAGSYAVDVSWSMIESCLERWGEVSPVDLDPDFQRAHVWTPDKQISYVEYIMRGGYGAKEIYWNCTTWETDWSTPVTIVDGKQRLEAVRAFMRGEIPAFGTFLKEFEGRFPWADYGMKWYVNKLTTRAEVLQWYLDLNTGGVVHTAEEIEKVRALLAKEAL